MSQKRRYVVFFWMITILVCASPAGAQRESGAANTPDARRTLVSKDIGSERWAITYNSSEDATVTGNVLAGDSPRFVWCTKNSGVVASNLSFRCFGADRCQFAPCAESDWRLIGEPVVPSDFLAAAGEVIWNPIDGVVAIPISFFEPPSSAQTERGSGVQIVPGGARVLVSKDVGGERWAITRNAKDGTVTGNVFRPGGGTPDFLWCTEVAEQNDPTLVSFSCSVASQAKEPPADRIAIRPGDLIVNAGVDIGFALSVVRPDTGEATEIAYLTFANPTRVVAATTIAVDAEANIFARIGVEPGIARIDARTGVISTLATDLPTDIYDPLSEMVLDGDELLLALKEPPSVVSINTRTGERAVVTQGGFLYAAYGVAIDPSGDLIVVGRTVTPVDGVNYVLPSVVRVDRTTGLQTVITAGGFMEIPTGIALGFSGEAYVSSWVPVPDRAGEKGLLVRVDLATGERTKIVPNHPWADYWSYLYEVEMLPNGDLIVDENGTLFRHELVTGMTSILSSTAGDDVKIFRGAQTSVPRPVWPF